LTQDPSENPFIAQRVDGPKDSFSDTSLNTNPPARLSMSGWISWILIAGFTVFILGSTTVQQFGEKESVTEASAGDLMQINLQAKMIVGQKSLLATAERLATVEPAIEAQTEEGAEADGEANVGDEAEEVEAEFTLPETDLSALDTGSYEQRLCYCGLVNEVDGPEAALEYLDDLETKVAEHDFERSDAQLEMESSVRSLMENYQDGNLSQDILDQPQQQQLKDRLGFSGELLLNPAGSGTETRAALATQSQTAAVAAVVFLVMAILFFLFGIVSLLFILTYVLTGSSPSQFIATNNAHNAYVETFALWLIVFFGLQMLVGHLELLKTNEQRMIANPIFFFGSLIVLLWPMLRGVPASEVFADIGWTPKKFFRNTFLSVAAYAAWLPAVLVGGFIVFVLMQLAPMPTAVGEFAVPAMPGHPIQEMLSGGDMLTWVTVVIAACVAAPIVEETMFRGVLYRHLRGLSMKYGKEVSIIFSAVVNGFIFASLHPQGILVVPLLTTLAIGFSFVREWRDSLWTSILMHAFNNSMVTLLMYFLL
jgi:membrane protease YdiL (CAAX protease family)